MNQLQNKVALITGASRGIGRSIALRFADEGCDIAFTYLSSQEAEATLAEIRAIGVHAECYCSDASDYEAAHAVVKKVIEDFGHLDVLVNNAGITRDALMIRMTEKQWDDVIDTNLKSAYNYIHAVTPIMMRQRSGSIISMSSVVGLNGNPGQANYAASKAGLIAMTKSVAKEVGPRGVRVNCLAPGFIETEMTNVLSQEHKDEFVHMIPMKRAGTPDDVANAAIFLASDLSSYVSAQVLGVNGAMI